ncbi:50S ribosomal protein L13 [Candidatus Micrarchaeota archaeon]|nr:50S ribosomal protein L13 [Candidatus Micrarchaeota archaeon]MBU1930923.1 50S ribosomal protein L13 [Candidatus Micrarchaeota archaeon]
MKTIDYSNLILGRAASKTAKLLLKGETIVIVNAEKAVVRGTKKGILEKFLRRHGWKAKGNPLRHGPKISRMPDRLVRFAIQHMLPYRRATGRQALERLTIFLGIPKKLEKASIEKWDSIENMEKKNFLTIAQISTAMGLQKKRDN